MDLDTRLAGDLAALEQGTTGPPPPASPAPVLPRWGTVIPFVLYRGDQFRPAPPRTGQPRLRHPPWTKPNRWDPRPVPAAPPPRQGRYVLGRPSRTIERHRRSGGTAHRTGLDGSAQLFAELDTTLADATIALYGAKYTSPGVPSPPSTRPTATTTKAPPSTATGSHCRGQVFVSLLMPPCAAC